MAHYAVPVKPRPATPAHAATLVLLRDRPAGEFDVLLMQRHRASKFAAGDFVFPGGKIEAADAPADAAAWCAGLGQKDASHVLGLEHAPETALAHWIGAIRETFEEAGILLARGARGPDPARLEAYRRACHSDKQAFWTMLRTERLTLATDRLVYFAHWITPEESPLRFDTRFFTADASAITHRVEGVIHADAELVELVWVELGSKPLADLHPMTRNVLNELDSRLATGPLRHDAPVPFFHFYGGKMQKDILG